MRVLLHNGEGWQAPDEAGTASPIASDMLSPSAGVDKQQPLPSSEAKNPRQLANNQERDSSHEPSLRTLTLLLRHNKPRSYNKALRLHRLLQRGPHGKMRPFGMLGYLRHSLPLDAKNFPIHSHRQIDQVYLKEDLPKEPRILICFTGNSAQLNMPIPCFHSLAYNQFDGLAYLFDRQRNLYIGRENQVISALHALKDSIPGCRFSALGTSGGGTILLRLPESLQFGRRISASPPVMRDQALMAQIEAGRLEEIGKARIFYSPSNAMDKRHFLHLQHSLPSELFNQCVFNLDWACQSHGTLKTVMSLGALPTQLAWLAERPEAEVAP